MKYFSEKGGIDSEHRGNLHWPGTANGFPFRGDVAPLLRGDEFEDQVAHAIDFHSRAFKLWEPEDKHAFDRIRDKICNGLYVEYVRYDRWSDANMGLIVWLEWGQIYGETVNGKSGNPLG
jgi:hypothetical protein